MGEASLAVTPSTEWCSRSVRSVPLHGYAAFALLPCAALPTVDSFSSASPLVAGVAFPTRGALGKARGTLNLHAVNAHSGGFSGLEHGHQPPLIVVKPECRAARHLFRGVLVLLGSDGCLAFFGSDGCFGILGSDGCDQDQEGQHASPHLHS